MKTDIDVLNMAVRRQLRPLLMDVLRASERNCGFIAADRVIDRIRREYRAIYREIY
jgi:hypothetical protein